MTTEENTGNRQAPTYARAGSALACFGVDRKMPRLYFIGVDSHLFGRAFTPEGWRPVNLPGPVVAPASPLACFGLYEADPRVYYVSDGSHRVVELAWRSDVNRSDVNPWAVHPLSAQLADDSPLIGIAAGGTEGRLYYVGTDRQLYELAPDAAGHPDPQVIQTTKVAPGSGLACKQDSQGLVMVFYIDATDDLLHVAAYTDPAEGRELLTFSIDGTHPAPGSALTCFNMVDKDNTRVYYLDRQHRINELAWNGSDQNNNVLPYKAMPGSPLTCFGYGGLSTRLYYLDDQARVNELAWQHGHWVHHVLPDPATPATAAPDSPLTCFGSNGTLTRLYYLDPDHRVNELAWDPTAKEFVNNPL
jgi:Fungal fucose-specific lectin